jgi:benzodiazapine receptor
MFSKDSWIWIFVVLFLLIGFGTSYEAKLSDVWKRVQQPKSAPPSIVFMVVWPLLYVLFGFSVSLVVRQVVSEQVNWHSIVFLVLAFVSTVLNSMWIIEFAKVKETSDQHVRTSLFILLSLTLTLALQLYCGHLTNKIAGICLIPYLVWSSFAVLLNSHMLESKVSK